MSNIKITCDSTADLAAEQYIKYDIKAIPLYINLDGTSYRDGVDLQPDDIYSFVNQTNRLPKTSAVTLQDYIDLFSEYTKDYEAVIHINIGSKFSSSYQNAVIAAEEFDNVFVVNSENLSTGSGILVLEAKRLASEGMEAKLIIEELNNRTPKIESSFVIDTLDYLRKGGRCTTVQAIGANLLNIKPTIEVIDGKMDVGKKYRGKYDKVIQKYVVDRLEGRTDINTNRIFITHSGCSEETIRLVKETIQKYQDFKEIIVTRASCTITCHCGPNTLGILFQTI